MTSGEIGIEVAPIRNRALDQPHFPCAIPFLHSPLAKDRGFDIIELFEINEAIDTIHFGEPFHGLRFMLMDAPDQVARDTDVQRASNLARQNVDVIIFVGRHALIFLLIVLSSSLLVHQAP